jgi:hypothetical protein
VAFKRIKTRQLQQRDRLVSILRAFNRLIYVSIKPNSTKKRADWLYTSNVALQLLKQRHKTTAEQHCPCFTPSQSCNKAADLNSLPALPPAQTVERSPA